MCPLRGRFAAHDIVEGARCFSGMGTAKRGAQIAFVSGRTGLPQIYTMEADEPISNG